MLEEEFKKIIAETFKVSPELIKEDTNFIQDLGVDSLTLMRFINEIESKYNIMIDDAQIGNLTTFDRAFEYIRSLISETER
jgi:acyl carrier protein